MGMANHLGKFILRMADLSEPLRQLLRKNSVCSWDEAQQKAFLQIKNDLMSPEVSARYDPNRSTIIAADASLTALGAVLLQVQDDGKRCPVCYTSRSLTDTVQRYAVIEKEALAGTWACEKFSMA